ncbi:retrovirus-related Pol polyprotein from transposon 17.6 [Ranitomeya variabilis]|uniref:retrovirus-related Pol polyprotein from transposon 17.6 n=1 Tax=Ranitomeya variabilis TaxID=490064 RepID=UPI0040571E4C
MDWGTHLRKVQVVIDDLREAGLTANPKKCHIGLEEARYLGYVIGRGVIKPQIDKIQAIQSWPQPVNKKQVQAFLGIAGYYRRFIPNFAAIATPLTDLTKGKDSVMVKWTSAAEEAFHSLKRALCSQPVLVTPDFSSEFVVQTDASDTGIGAVLSQVKDGVEHPVLYLSWKLNVHEQRYAVVEKECLAIKWALDSLKYYLAGRKFKLVTDHAPLKWMHLHKDRNSRVTRWFLALQAYSFTQLQLQALDKSPREFNSFPLGFLTIPQGTTAPVPSSQIVSFVEQQSSKNTLPTIKEGIEEDQQLTDVYHSPLSVGDTQGSCFLQQNSNKKEKEEEEDEQQQMDVEGDIKLPQTGHMAVRLKLLTTLANATTHHSRLMKMHQRAMSHANQHDILYAGMLMGC